MTLYSQFRAQYPTASLTADLLVSEPGHYVVQAVVKIGDVPLASGLSAASAVEVAEDQARARALVVLGFEDLAPSPSVQVTDRRSHELPPGAPAQLSPAATSRLEDTDLSDLSHRDLSAPQDAGWTDSWNWEEEEESNAPDSMDAGLPAPQLWDRVPPGLEDGPSSPPQRIPTQGRRSPRVGRKPSPKMTKAAASRSPIDLSDIIAQTDIELKRLGWTHTEGRQFLERSYNKRSRQQLTDSELMEFLEYLKTQTVSQEPPF
ncbi:hypothetical protein [Lyngbya confervoides]|uniref:DRBM domain-containing protein n=1 Tax=Lyngbya confervoides BDU141951 TaxID=1574623 RepID=A0ABD4T119_9CYAN|nr:hypothetical protein [Lyngbya confervoides]MCM1982106.1 hypothetical protein [Lyngbya confervoides BDU141951]